MIEPRFLSTKELCTYLGVGRSFIYETLRPTYRLHPVLIGRRLKWDRKEVDALIARRKLSDQEAEQRIKDGRRNP